MRTDRILVVMKFCRGAGLAWCFVLAGVAQTLAQSTAAAVAGYAIVTPATIPAKTLGGQVTIEQDRGTTAFDEGIVSSSLSDSFMIVLSWNSATSEDLGLAFVNPQSSSAAVSVALDDVSGNQDGAPVSLTIPAGGHIAKLTGQQLFQNAPGLSDSFAGSIQVTSSVPIAVTALQFQGANYRVVSPLVIGSTGNLPAKGNTGGAGALIFPQIVFGGDWFSEIAVINPNSAAIGIRVDLFDNDGNPWVLNLNGTSASTFSTQVAARGIAIFTGPRQAGLRSLRTLLAKSNQLSDLGAVMSTAIAQANAEVNSSQTLQPANRAALLSMIQTLLAQINAVKNGLIGQTGVEGARILSLMNLLRKTEDAAAISQIASEISAIGVAISTFTQVENALLSQVQALIATLHSIGPPIICPALSGCGFPPLPPIPMPPVEADNQRRVDY